MQQESSARRGHRHPSLPAGTGMLIVGAASLMLWGMIAGLAGIVGIL